MKKKFGEPMESARAGGESSIWLFLFAAWNESSWFQRIELSEPRKILIFEERNSRFGSRRLKRSGQSTTFGISWKRISEDIRLVSFRLEGEGEREWN
jgi:hypothetical protein